MEKTPKPAEHESKTPAAPKPTVVTIGESDGTIHSDLTGLVTVEAVAGTPAMSVTLAAVDEHASKMLTRALESITSPSDAVICAGAWRGEGIAFRNRRRDDADLLVATIGVRFASEAN